MTERYVTAQSLGVDPDTLPPRERRLFAALARDPHRVISKAQLIEQTRSPGSRTLDSDACRLRARFHAAGAGRVVVNVWGVGYKLLDEPSVETACPKCRSTNIRKATVYWQCLTCRKEWIADA